MTVLGTRPEIIRLSRVIEKLDKNSTHILVHTGQNFDKNLSDIFFEDLLIRKPDYYLGIKGSSFGDQLAQILTETEKIIKKEQPDKILILGDTNSSLSAIIAKRMGIPVVHMEAGNRCFDDRVPEEVNRRIIDHCSDVLLPYTERSRVNLIREGIGTDRIHVIGNPIFEVIEHYQKQIENSDILKRLDLLMGNYFLVTMHRAENVDDPERVTEFLEALKILAADYQLPVICSLHPRTKDKLEHFGFSTDLASIRFYDPFGFFDFISLEKNAYCVISDSGTVQEECCIFHIPNVTIRDVTERPETIECGSNILSGADRNSVVNCVRLVLSESTGWKEPVEYVNRTVSTTVVKIVLGFSRPKSSSA
jgi:UDP-N-acetylglucosamine 2-epimerase (non-hydrolysing)